MSSNGHALLSPSGAAGWSRCLGKPAMEFGLPDSSNDFSDEGTAAHQVGAWALESGKDAVAFIGRRVDLKTRTWEVTAEMASEVQKYVDLVRQLSAGKQLLIEQSVPLDHLTGEGYWADANGVRLEPQPLSEDLPGNLPEGAVWVPATGTSDAIIIDDEELTDVDLKYGKGVRVDAFYTEIVEVTPFEDSEERGIAFIEHGNEQLMMYASGALEKFGALGDFKRVRLMIVQPRLDHVSEWTCTVEELRRFEASIRTTARTVIIAFEHRVNWLGKSNEYLVPGDKQCRWCKAKATCPALTAHALSTVTGNVDDFEDLTKGAPVLAKKVEVEQIDPKAPHVTNVILGALFPALDLIDDWLRAVRAKIESELLAGREVPGTKLVAGKKGARAWSDADEVEKKLKAMRLKQEQMYDFKLISPTTAEKLLKDQQKRWKQLEPLITQADGKPHVAPLSDKRPALVVKPAIEDFDVVAPLDVRDFDAVSDSAADLV